MAVALVSVLRYLPRFACEEQQQPLQSFLSESKTSISAVLQQQRVPENIDVSECIVLFAAFCNGNMGDVVQAASMRHLVDDLMAAEQCIWYAHPLKEDPANGFREGEFFGGDVSRLLAVGCDAESAQQVSFFYLGCCMCPTTFRRVSGEVWLAKIADHALRKQFSSVCSAFLFVRCDRDMCGALSGDRRPVAALLCLLGYFCGYNT